MASLLIDWWLYYCSCIFRRIKQELGEKVWEQKCKNASDLESDVKNGKIFWPGWPWGVWSWNERRLKEEQKRGCMDIDKEERHASSSVEDHTRLSSGGVEDPVVRTRLWSQMWLVILQQLGSLIFFNRHRGRRRSELGLQRGQHRGGLFFGGCRSWGGRLFLDLSCADHSFGGSERKICE